MHKNICRYICIYYLRSLYHFIHIVHETDPESAQLPFTVDSSNVDAGSYDTFKLGISARMSLGLTSSAKQYQLAPDLRKRKKWVFPSLFSALTDDARQRRGLAPQTMLKSSLLQPEVYETWLYTPVQKKSRAAVEASCWMLGENAKCRAQ